MEIRKLFADDDAVSPVIGVILMVAITVILAAVIGTFVLGLGDQVSDANPQAQFDFSFTADADGLGDGGYGVKIVHNGGDELSADQTSVMIGGTAGTDANYGTGPYTAGSTVYDSAGTDEATGSDTVRVIWTSSSGGDTATIGQATAPA